MITADTNVPRTSLSYSCMVALYRDSHSGRPLNYEKETVSQWPTKVRFSVCQPFINLQVIKGKFIFTYELFHSRTNLRYSSCNHNFLPLKLLSRWHIIRFEVPFTVLFNEKASKIHTASAPFKLQSNKDFNLFT